MAGSNIKGITIEFRGDTTRLDKAMRTIKTDSKSVDQQLKEVNRALKFNPNNTELLRQKFDLLKQKVNATEKELKELKAVEAQLKAQNVSKQSEEWMKVRRSIIEAESKLKHFNAEVKKVQYANVTKLGNAFQSAGQKMRTAGMYSSIGAGAMIVAGKKLLELSATQNQAETKLVEVYKSRMGANKAAAKSTMELASALQKQGVIGDEVTLSGAQQLATYASMPETVNKLLPAMDDLLVQQKGVNATAEDATAMANLFGKAMMGNTGALKRVGISFTAAQEEVLKYGTEEEKAAMLAEVVNQNVGKMNETFAQTPEGQMAQLRNTLGDIGERLGTALLPALASAAKWISENVVPAVEKLVGFIEAHPVIAKIAVGITALLAVGGPLLIFIGSLISAIGSIMTLAPALGAAFTALTGPVGIVIGIIAALIAIGVALYKNWDKIKAAAGKLKDWVVSKFTQLKNTVASIFNNIKEKMLAPIRTAAALIKAIINKIKGFFHFKIHLPHIKLPHFRIHPRGWKLGDLLHGEIPSLGIDWYAKGGIFQSPSVIGVGEKGPEAVLPIEKLNAMMAAMADSIVNGISTTMALQGAGNGGEVKIVNYLYPNGPAMGEQTVKMYDQYKRILG